jgi:hypothetical protein
LTGGSIDVYGEGYLNLTTLSCSFDSLIVSATYINSSLIRCMSPVMKYPTGVSLKVANNGVDFADSSKSLTYYMKVLPSIGPNVGRTLVSIQIPSIITYPFDDLRCVFGDVGQSVALLIPSGGYGTVYQCLSPPRTRTLLGSTVLDEVAMPISLLLDQQVSIATGSHFYYMNVPVVSSLQPIAGPETGGWVLQLNVTSPYKPLINAYCRFAKNPLTQTPAVAMRRVGGVGIGVLSCTVPPLSIGSNTVEIVLPVCGDLMPRMPRTEVLNTTCEDLVYEAGSIVIHARVTISSIDPPMGSAKGQQLVTVAGTGMDQAPLCCEFNGILSLTSTTSASSVTCLTPKQTDYLSPIVTVRVVLCNAFTAYEEALSDMSQFLTFTYTEDQKVRSFLPTVGYVSGGTTVSMIGYGFTSYSKYLCSFTVNKNSIQSVVRVNAAVVGSSLITCNTPNLNLNVTTMVGFIVSVNGTDDSSQLVSASFTFLESPVFFSLSPSIGTFMYT